MSNARLLTSAMVAALLWQPPQAAAQTPPSDAERTAAVRRTIATNLQCSPRLLGPYYWEIGRAGGAAASGKVSTFGSPDAVDADTPLSIASASKWIYVAQAVERDGDVPEQRRLLNMTSGYSNFRTSNCPVDGTVAECDPGQRSVSEAIGRVFHYDGGHMQRHAIDTGLGPLDAIGLTAELDAVFGTVTGLSYRQPGVAGGLQATPRDYAGVLRRMLADASEPLRLGALLGSHAVCTWPGEGCGASRLIAIPEQWHYGLGHWVEDDPATTPPENVAFSSPGSFGFYPWIDHTRSFYGLLARQTKAFTGVDEGYASVKCGRLLRLAWLTATPQ